MRDIQDIPVKDISNEYDTFGSVGMGELLETMSLCDNRKWINNTKTNTSS